MIKALRFPLLLGALSVLAGCASVSPTANVNRQYDPEASRAYNLAQAAGMYKVRDTELGDAQYSDAMSNLQRGMSDAMLFNSSTGLGLSWGKSLGLGLLSTLNSAPGHTERDSLFGWVSTADASTPEEARHFILEHFETAALGALDELGIAYVPLRPVDRFESHGRKGLSFIIDDASLGCPSLSENPNAREVCVVGISMAVPGERTPIAPKISGVDGPAYWFEAHNQDRFIRFAITQPKGTNVPKEAIAAALTARLPNGIYAYLAPGDERPAMVFDQGEPLLFVKRAG
ncbi:hypothetical protein DFO67_11558 [Modicisalibacter xianhensis]|uniref:Lipoprotein n=1 Tax=Modicisalibacter xianhensis TaxID=442341 RepID=A0A4V3GTH5_9GAMM|nr:hypothetical protein [Halomonas xianhensis]TDX26793.1 hypothetical protein DFO67_11558 [Halomonas xianhensis]